MLAGHLDAYTSTGGYVFTSAEGTPLRRNFYRQHFKPAVNRADLPPALRFHDYADIGITTTSGTPVPRYQFPRARTRRRSRSGMGHSTIRLTFDRYGHLFPSLDSRLRDGLERAFREAATSGPPGADPLDAGAPGDRHPILDP